MKISREKYNNFYISKFFTLSIQKAKTEFNILTIPIGETAFDKMSIVISRKEAAETLKAFKKSLAPSK